MSTAQRPQSQFITLSKYYSLKHDQCSASASHKRDIYVLSRTSPSSAPPACMIALSSKL